MDKQVTFTFIVTIIMAVSILTWNVRGALSSSLSLCRIIDEHKPDFIAITEHKLTNKTKLFLNSLHPEYMCYINETEFTHDCRIISESAIMYKKSLFHNIQHIETTESTRISTVEVSQSNGQNLYIISVYMPSSFDMTDYIKNLDNLYNLYYRLSNKGTVIIAGDMNARYSDTASSYAGSQKHKYFKEFMEITNLIPINKTNLCKGEPHTFPTYQCTLDYILVPDDAEGFVTSCEVLSNTDIETTSDHLPVKCSLSITTTEYRVQPTCHTHTAWRKAEIQDKINYQLCVHDKLATEVEYKDIQIYDEIEYRTSHITEVLLDASKTHIPQPTFKGHLKPYWTSEVHAHHKVAKQKRLLWMADGKPRSIEHESFVNYKLAKRTFRNMQRKAYEGYINKINDDIDKAAGCDVHLFWQLIRKHSNKNKNNTCNNLKLNSTIIRDPKDITNTFADYFADLYKSEETATTEHFNNIDDPYLDTDIDFNEVDKAIRQLNNNKAPGHDNIQAEHIKYGGQLLIKQLVSLYNLIIQNSYLPKSWKKGIIIPIHKGNKKPHNELDSYRPVTLLPVLYKLFETILNNRILTWTHLEHHNFPSVQQQGFQKQLSCATTAFTLHETINTINEQNSTAFMAFLDIRKAFDTVWHPGIFQKLYEFGIKGKTFKIIQHAYEYISSSVMCNGMNSKWIDMQRGIRQGGVLSCFLYLLFMDGLSKTLHSSNYGAKICDTEAGSPTLADDMTLISLSPLYLQKQLDICYDYSKTWKYEYSPTKCSIMIIGNKKKQNLKYSWNLGNCALKQVKTQEHLGIIITQDLTCHQSIQKATKKGKSKLFCISALGDTNIDTNPVTSKSLYHKIILPSVLYGSETWNSMKQTDIKNIQTFQHLSTKVLLKLPQRTRSDMCESILGLQRITSEIDKRKLIFLEKLISLPPSSTPKQIFLQRLIAFTTSHGEKGTGFIKDIFQLMETYHLMPFITNYIEHSSFPDKIPWKLTVKKHISEYEEQQLKNRMDTDNDFNRFKLIHDKYTLHPFLKSLKFNNNKCQVLSTLRYLTTTKSPFSCDECDTRTDDELLHLATECVKTNNIRDLFTDDLINYFDIELYLYIDNCDGEELLNILLGKRLPSNVLPNIDEKHKFHKLCTSFMSRIRQLK